jgi:ribonuclease-3
MTMDNIDIIHRAEAILGYRFTNESLLNESLTHASVAEHPLSSNERMEFLGDAILGYVVCEYLFNLFPEQREGDLTKIKSAVVSRRSCALISDKIGLTELLNLGKGMSGRTDLPESLPAAVYESIVAAIYLDGGMEPAKHFILKYMKELVDEAAESTHQQNFKSVLQQHAQRRMADLPTYMLLDEKGPDHSKCFEVCVEIGGQRFPSAWGQSKKQAEQRAALLALEAMELVVIDEAGNVHMADHQAKA